MPIYSLGERRFSHSSDEWFIAPSADIIGAVRLGHQANVWFNCVLRADNEVITIGDRCNVQDGSVFHADRNAPLTLEDNVSIGHKVMLHGCTIGAGTLIGMNAVVLNRARIGAGSIVGAHSLVPEDKVFPDGVMLMGSPAKVVRELRPEEKIRVLGIAQNYVDRAARYRLELKLESA